MKRTDLLQWTCLIVASFTTRESNSSCEPQILPFPTAVVTESHSVTITCFYNETGSVLLIIWSNYDNDEITIFIDDCTNVGSYFISNLYRYQCTSSTSFTLTILHVSEDQHGDQWSCEMYEESCAVYTRSRASTIYVEVPVQSVTFYSPPGTLINVIENELTELNCITSEERPRSTILWFIGDNSTGLSGSSVTPVNNDTRAQTTGLLQHRFTRESNGKQLFCTAKNSPYSTKVSEKKELSVLYPPSLPEFRYAGKTISGVLRVVLSDDVSLICVSDGNPSPTTKWNGQSSIALEIMNIQKSNEGHYNCTATNTMIPSLGASDTETVSKNIYIDVMYGPSSPKMVYNYGIGSETIEPGTMLKVIEGKQSIEITCSDADGNPPPSYFWSGLQTSQTGVLQIFNISRYDSGSYTCHAQNTLVRTVGVARSDYFNRTLTIDVLFPPDTEPFPDLNLNEGNSLDVTCNLTSYPASVYRWTRSSDGQILSHSARLIIHNMQRNATGVYICDVEIIMTPTGEIQKTTTISEQMTVTVLHVPECVASLHSVVVSSTVAAIVWILGSSGGHPQTFYVEYKNIQDKDWSLVTTMEDETSDKINSLLLTDLIPDSRYEVRMFSGNVLGNSSRTDAITFKTKEGQKDGYSDVTSSDNKIVPGAVGGLVGLALGIACAIIIICVFRFLRASRKTTQSSNKKDEFNMSEQSMTTAHTSQAIAGVQFQSSGSTQYEELSQARNQQAEYTSLTVPQTNDDARLKGVNFCESVDNRLMGEQSQGLDKKDSNKSNVYDNLNLKL